MPVLFGLEFERNFRQTHKDKRTAMEFRTYQVVGILMNPKGTIKEKQSATSFVYRSTGNKTTLNKTEAHLQTILKIDWIKLIKVVIDLSYLAEETINARVELKFFQGSIYLYHFHLQCPAFNKK